MSVNKNLSGVSENIKIIFSNKVVNSFLVIILSLFFASFMGILMSSNFIYGLLIFGVLFSVFITVLCISNVNAGIFIILIYGFISFFISNYFFNRELPIGTIADALMIIILLGIIINQKENSRNLTEFFKEPLVLFMLSTLVFNSVQFFNPNSLSLDSTVLATRKFFEYLLILYIFYCFFKSLSGIKNYINHLFFVSTLCGLYGCIQQWHGLFAFELAPILADPHTFGLLFQNGDFRKFSTLSDPSSFGIIMSVCSIFFITSSVVENNKLIKIKYYIGSLFMILGMAYSGTRTAYVALIGGLFFFILLNFNKRKFRIFGFMSFCILLFLIFAPFYGGSTLQRFRSTFSGQEDESYKVRVLSRKFIQPYIQSHPIGGGLGTTGFSGAIEHPGHPLANFQPDSSYVKRAAEAGWIGLAIVLIIYFLTIKIGVRKFFECRNDEDRGLLACTLACLFGFYIAEFAQVAIGGIPDVFVYYPMLAIILSKKSPENKND